MRRCVSKTIVSASLGVATALALTLGSGAALAERDEEIAAAEALVSELYYEGLPYAEARDLTPAGAAHLTALLEDPASEPYHANIVLALGIAGHPGCVETLMRYAATPPAHASRHRESARRMVPLAMGYAAHRDARALAWLRERARAGEAADQMTAITGLALAARPEADTTLRELAEAAPDGAGASAERDQRAQHLAEALAYSARLQRDGYHAVLGEGQ